MLRFKKFLFSFLQFQAAAIIATAVDFGIYFLLKYTFNNWYLLATFLGASFGAVVNFTLLRYWTKTNKTKLLTQAGKYMLVALGSLLLNTSLVYLITEFFNVPSDLSKVIAAVTVAISYNFILQKYIVFKAKS